MLRHLYTSRGSTGKLSDMVRNIGIAGGAAVVVAGGLLLTAYEVQGETMPGWLFSTIIIVGLVVLILGGAGFIIGRVIVPAIEHARLWSIRMPLFRADTPDPHQRLLDIEKEQLEHPETHLLILKAELTDKDLRAEQFRPWLEIGLTMKNTNICDIYVGRAEGHATYKGNELPDPVESRQHSNKPLDHLHVYTLKLYVPRETTETLMEEIRQPRHRMSSLGFSKVRIEVVSQGEQGCQTWLSLASLNYIDVGD